MDTSCHNDGSWGDEFTDQEVAGCQKLSKDGHGMETHPESVDGPSVTDQFTDQQVAGHKNLSKDMQGLDTHPKPVDGPTVTDDFTGQKVAGHKDLPKDRQGRAVVPSVNVGISDPQTAGPLQNNSALDTPDPVNLPSVTEELTDQPAVDPGQKDTTAAKSEENASPTEKVVPSTDMLTDAANTGFTTFRSKVYYLQPPAVWAHADVRLVSSDSRRFKVNAALLASASPHLGNVLKSLPDGEDAVISTELCADKLKLFIEFVTTGTLSVKSLDPVLDDFACLGVDLLKGYKFQMSYNAKSDPLKAAYLAEEKSEKKVVVPNVSGVLRKPRILLIPKSQLHSLTAIKPEQVPVKKRQLISKTNTAKKRKLVGKTGNDGRSGHFFVCSQPNCAKFFEDSTEFYLHKMKCNPKRFEAVLSKGVKTDPRQARRERREREKEEKALPESRELKLEPCDDISIDYDAFKDEDIKKEAMEMSTAKKSRNTLEVSSSAIIAKNYFDKNEINADGNYGSQKEMKQEGNSSTIMCSIPNCLRVFQDAREYYKHVMNCPPRKPGQKNKRNEPAQKTSPFESVVGDSTVCPVCGMELSSRQSLQNHLESFHAENKTFKCPQCPKMFASDRLVDRHKEAVHDTYICDLCGRSIKTRKEKDHIIMFHTPEDQKPFQCKTCVPVKGFLYKVHLDEHMNIHTGKKPFKCTSCPGVAYANKANLSAHIRSVHKGIKRKPKNSSIPK